MQRNYIQGTQNNDFLTDTILDDDIFGLDGDDQIKVSSGNDELAIAYLKMIFRSTEFSQ